MVILLLMMMLKNADLMIKYISDAEKTLTKLKKKKIKQVKKTKFNFSTCMKLLQF